MVGEQTLRVQQLHRSLILILQQFRQLLLDPFVHSLIGDDLQQFGDFFVVLAAGFEVGLLAELVFVEFEFEVLAVAVEEIDQEHEEKQEDGSGDEELAIKGDLLLLASEGGFLALFFGSDVGLGFCRGNLGIGAVGALGLFEFDVFDFLGGFRFDFGGSDGTLGFQLFEAFGFAGFDLSETGFGIGLGFEEADVFVGRIGFWRRGVGVVSQSRFGAGHQGGVLGVVGVARCEKKGDAH